MSWYLHRHATQFLTSIKMIKMSIQEDDVLILKVEGINLNRNKFDGFKY